MGLNEDALPIDEMPRPAGLGRGLSTKQGAIQENNEGNLFHVGRSIGHGVAAGAFACLPIVGTSLRRLIAGRETQRAIGVLECADGWAKADRAIATTRPLSGTVECIEAPIRDFMLNASTSRGCNLWGCLEGQTAQRSEQNYKPEFLHITSVAGSAPRGSNICKQRCSSNQEGDEFA